MAEPTALDVTLSVEAGPMAGGRVTCLSTKPLVLELAADVQELSTVRVASLLLGAGARLVGHDAVERRFSIDVFERIGVRVNSDVENGRLPSTRFDHFGFTVEAGLRLRAPLGSLPTLVLEGAVRRLFLGATTHLLFDETIDDSAGITTLPLMLGVEFPL